jgi:pimeloyl-ACP methyl ester carboxylesterase
MRDRDEVLMEFLNADTRGRMELLGDEETASVVRGYLGAGAMAELRRIAARGDVQEHLGVKVPPNLVFVPGVMGSLLRSETKGGVWWIDARTRHHLNDLRLSSDGSEDLDPDNQIDAFAVDTSYEPFATAILARDDFGHRHFAYDWRKAFSRNTKALRDLIVNLYSRNGEQPVHVVAHSMGGLLARAALKEFGDDLWPRVGRVVFIGTPHYGSPAIAGYLKDHLWGWDLMAVLGLYLSREAFRSLWGVLSLLPAPMGVYPGTQPKDNPKWRAEAGQDLFWQHPCTNFDLYDASAWELGLDVAAATDLQRILDGVAAFYREIHAWHSDPKELPQECCDRMLMVAGVGYKTLFRLEYGSRAGGLWRSLDKITSRIAGDPHRDGDGRVPVASATLRRVAMRYVKGVHGGLTNIPAVYSDVFRWLKGEPLRSLAETPDDALSEHLSLSGGRSEAPRLDTTANAQGDDPGYWRSSGADSDTLSALDQAIGRGEVPEFNQLKLL